MVNLTLITRYVYASRKSYDVNDYVRGTIVPGVKYRFYFDNGYGASVIKHIGSYGYDRDLWELALLRNCGNEEWDLCYKRIVGYDVLGYLTDEQVDKVLSKIEKGEVDEPVEGLWD